MTSIRLAGIFLLVAPFLSSPAVAHDPSAWGGLFRSRDGGQSWFPVDAGLFIGGALDVAISPGDPNHLLYATDTRLLRSRNGGRDWVQEPGDEFAGAVFAVRFLEDGKGALASTATSIQHSADAGRWENVVAPAGSLPVRVFQSAEGKFFLGGESGLFVGDNKGRNWSAVSKDLPQAPVAAIVVHPSATGTIFVVAQDRVWASSDGGRTWRQRSDGLPPGRIEALVFEGRLWTFVGDRLHASDDNGVSWKPFGNALPQADVSVRGIAADAGAKRFVLATHRGVMRSTDGAQTWAVVEGNLPVHLEAGFLARDPLDAATLYAGFSLTPYTEIRRRAGSGANLLARLDPMSLAGGGAFLVLTMVFAGLAVGRLSRARG
jgi:photosystem II stability/assembly factor-like uncharacterized protein